MAFEAKLKYLRISPRKVRLVADLVRGKKADEAQAILGFTVKRACLPVLKLLNSALANAKDVAQKDGSTLFISKITVDEGPTLKRILPRAKGKADRMMKRSSHITLVLDEKWPETEKVKKSKKVLNKKEESVVTDGENK
ncbi:MAG: 50S ribosomal protein L22 [Parcubacteria group bacterium ADurb.Bin216]|nr:MAG: 50S ribosomal protein L22 [Parcubacteria group bacterium ADurb.Bin216]